MTRLPTMLPDPEWTIPGDRDYWVRCHLEAAHWNSCVTPSERREHERYYEVHYPHMTTNDVVGWAMHRAWSERRHQLWLQRQRREATP